MDRVKIKTNILLCAGIALITALSACVTPSAEQKSEVKEEKVLARNTLEEICKEKGIPYPPQNLQVVLNKAEGKLNLQINKMVLKSYKVAVGEKIDAPRLYQGDNATPEGLYKILLKQKSEEERSILLNYPTVKDMDLYKKAIQENVIPKDKTGGNLKIAEGIKIFSGDITKATDGSIAVSPEEFKELYNALKAGMPVTIERGNIAVAKTEKIVEPQKQEESKVAGLQSPEPVKPITSQATPVIPVKPELSVKALIPAPVASIVVAPAPSATQVIDQTKQTAVVKSELPVDAKLKEVVFAPSKQKIKAEPKENLIDETKVAGLKSPEPVKPITFQATPVIPVKPELPAKALIPAPVASVAAPAPSKQKIKTEPKENLIDETKVAGLKSPEPVKPITSQATPVIPVKPELPAKILIPAPVASVVAAPAPSTVEVIDQTKQAAAVKPELPVDTKLKEAVVVSSEENIRPDTKGNLSIYKGRESFSEGETQKTSADLNAYGASEYNGILSFKKPLFKVTDKPVRNVEPRFSPGGKYISFSRIDRVYNDVWIWDKEINQTRRITLQREDLKEESGMKGARFSYGGIWGNDPEKMLIVSSFKGNYDIYLYDLGADKFVAITDNRAWDGNPSWSPDGKLLAFVSGRKGNGDIWLKKIGRYYFSKELQLTDNPGIDFGPVWSKDSKKVFYTSRQFENYDIYVIDTDEQIPIRLTFKESADRYVSISPTGKKIAFFSDFNISVMDLEGLDFDSLEVQTDPNGWRYKEISSADSEKRTTVLIPNISEEVKEQRGGRAVTYKKNRQFINALTSIDGPLWTTDESAILFVANKPLKPIYAVNLLALKAKDNANIYEIETESEINSDLNLSADGKYLAHVTFRNDYSKFNNNISLVEFSNPPKQKSEIRLVAKLLPEFLIKQAKTWYQITNPPPQDVAFVNRGKTGLISGNGVIGVKGGR